MRIHPFTHFEKKMSPRSLHPIICHTFSICCCNEAWTCHNMILVFSLFVSQLNKVQNDFALLNQIIFAFLKQIRAHCANGSN